MRLSDVRELVRVQRPQLHPDARALHRCHSVEDFRRAARRRLPRGAFDYIDGGAGDEHSMRANEAAFGDYELYPSTLRGVEDTDTTVDILGRRSALPLGLAPTGFTRMAHTDGERAVARAAGGAGIPYALSTMGTVSIEELAAVADFDHWFQLYIWRDRGLSRDLVDRAAASGYRVLMITVDTPVSGHRERDLRNGFTIPPELRPGMVADIALHARCGFGCCATGRSPSRTSVPPTGRIPPGSWRSSPPSSIPASPGTTSSSSVPGGTDRWS